MSEQSFHAADEPQRTPPTQRSMIEREAAGLGVKPEDLRPETFAQPGTKKYVEQVWAGLIIDAPVLKAERERRRHEAERLAARAEAHTDAVVTRRPGRR